MITMCIITLLFIALAVVILAGKGDWLIAGYNTASQQEKQQVNIKRLRLVVAAILVLTVVALDIPFIIGQENDASAHVVAVIVVLCVAVAGIILANTWCKKK